MAEEKGYNHRKDRYGRSLGGWEPYFAHYLGAMGEKATSIWAIRNKLPHELEWEILDGTDGGHDIWFGDASVQIKTRWTGHRDRVRRFKKDGGLVGIDASYYVFTRAAGVRESFDWKVDLLGWVTQDELRKYGFYEKAKYEHWNLWIDPRDMRPMRSLPELLRGAMKRHGVNSVPRF